MLGARNPKETSSCKVGLIRSPDSFMKRWCIFDRKGKTEFCGLMFSV
jgi:hypothetical protein